MQHRYVQDFTVDSWHLTSVVLRLRPQDRHSYTHVPWRLHRIRVRPAWEFFVAGYSNSNQSTMSAARAHG